MDCARNAACRCDLEPESSREDGTALWLVPRFCGAAASAASQIALGIAQRKPCQSTNVSTTSNSIRILVGFDNEDIDGQGPAEGDALIFCVSTDGEDGGGQSMKTVPDTFLVPAATSIIS